MFIPYNIEKNMSSSEKISYYNKLRKYCESLSRENQKEISNSQKMISKLYNPKFYDNKLEVIGEKNIPSNEYVIFVCNHSNSHDIFSMYSILERLNISTSVMVATDCLNMFSISVFAMLDSTFLKRNDKVSSNNSIYKMASKIFSGKTGVIFGESTWNLHPIKPMQNLKIGSAKIAAITGGVVVPTILEYIETPYICDKEIQLYEKAVISFGKPHRIKATDNMAMETLFIQNNMEKMRKEIWEKNNINRDNIDVIDKNLYLNHVYLKKFKALGFKYDSLKESSYLRKDINGNVENEYCLNRNDEFVPGITYQKKII